MFNCKEFLEIIKNSKSFNILMILGLLDFKKFYIPNANTYSIYLSERSYIISF